MTYMIIEEFEEKENKPSKRDACKECWNMMSGRCDSCGRNIFGNEEKMDWEL